MIAPFSFLNSVAQEDFDDKHYVAVGTNCALWSNTRGKTWNVASIPNGAWKKVNFGPDGVCMAVGTNCCAISFDRGQTWESRSIPNATYVDIAYLASSTRWIVVQNGPVANGIAIARTSDNNGTSWTNRNIGSIAQSFGRLQSVVVKDNNVRICADNSGTYNLARSTNGTSWTLQAYDLGKNSRSLSYINSTYDDDSDGFFALAGIAGNDRVAFTSPGSNFGFRMEGIGSHSAGPSAGSYAHQMWTIPLQASPTWLNQQYGFEEPSPQNTAWNDIAARVGTTPENRHFVAVTSLGDNRIARIDGEIDDTSWTLINDPEINTMELQGVCYG